MSFDAENMFSEVQKLTVSAPSAHTVKAGANVGEGAPVFVSFFVAEALQGATGLAVHVQDADKPEGPFATIQSTGELPVASLHKGAVVHMGSLPPVSKAYLRLQYAVSGTASAGAVTAGLVTNRQSALSAGKK